jgi:hypothetical protein
MKKTIKETLLTFGSLPLFCCSLFRDLVDVQEMFIFIRDTKKRPVCHPPSTLSCLMNDLSWGIRVTRNGNKRGFS